MLTLKIHMKVLSLIKQYQKIKYDPSNSLHVIKVSMAKLCTCISKNCSIFRFIELKRVYMVYLQAYQFVKLCRLRFKLPPTNTLVLFHNFMRSSIPDSSMINNSQIKTIVSIMFIYTNK